MKQDQKSVCQFENKAEEITAGDIFYLRCKWPPFIDLSPPLRIELLKNQDPYGLFILDVVSIFPGEGYFKVTSYRPGNYETEFQIIGEKGVASFSPLSWQTKSVIPKGQEQSAKPYPPYGPWLFPSPNWYGPFFILTGLLFVTFLVLKVVSFFKRKKHIQEVQKRIKGKIPFYQFISQATSLNRQITQLPRDQFLKDLKMHLLLFLENELFILAQGQNVKKIMKELKTYHRFLYQKYGKSIQVLFVELENSLLSSDKIGVEGCEQLLDMARHLVINIYQQRSQ